MGVVTDPSSAAVPGAVVELVDQNRGTAQTSTTDRDGTYRFTLPPGRYTLAISHSGFRKQVCDVEVRLGPPGTVNVALEIAEAHTTVKVAREALLIQAENGDVFTTTCQQQISEVPNPGNDLTYIAQTAPGALMNTDSGGFGGAGNFAILGMPAVSNLFTINGMNDT